MPTQNANLGLFRQDFLSLGGMDDSFRLMRQAFRGIDGRRLSNCHRYPSGCDPRPSGYATRLSGCDPRPGGRDPRLSECDPHPSDRHPRPGNCDPRLGNYDGRSSGGNFRPSPIGLS